MRVAGVRRVCLSLVVVFLIAAPALAWRPETRMSMAGDAIRLMPATLRMALEGHRDEVMRGVLEPLTGEDAPEHRAPWSAGSLDETLALEASGLVEALGRQTPFAQLARRFGRLAHYVMDAGFPPGIGDGTNDADERFAHFAQFCESRREKFPLVFYGHDDPHLATGDFRAFAVAVMERARDEDRELARAYAAAGQPPDPAAFDDRSVPFAVGSLSYSHCVTDVVRAWLAAWRAAEGDMGRTPYWNP